MIRPRFGIGVRSISLAAGLVAAIALSGTALAGKPVPSATVTLGFSGCSATIDVTWDAVPGQAKTFQVVLTNNVNGTLYTFDSGTAHRTGTSSRTAPLTSDSSKTFTARIWFNDRSDVTILGFSSSPIDAPCV